MRQMILLLTMLLLTTPLLASPSLSVSYSEDEGVVTTTLVANAEAQALLNGVFASDWEDLDEGGNRLYEGSQLDRSVYVMIEQIKAKMYGYMIEGAITAASIVAGQQIQQTLDNAIVIEE